MNDENKDPVDEQEKKSLFDKLYDATEKARRIAKRPIARSRCKRKFAYAIEDCALKIIDLESELLDMRGAIENLDVNKLMEKRRVLNKLKELKQAVKEEYQELFNEELIIPE